MDNVSFVHMLNTFADLSHIIDNFSLGHGVPLGSYSLK
jgi:hypothetical protein